MLNQTVIHPSSVIEPGAEIGTGVRIGPFCHISADAVLGDNVELIGHVSVLNATTIGAGTKVYPMTTLGAPPQNNKHKGGRTTLTIGRNCTIRENATMHTGTDTSRGATVIGDNGNFLAYAHIAHDCIVGSNCTFANGATLGGHCEIGDNVNIGGLTAVHQFVRVGDNAFLGGCSAVVGDVIPYGIAVGNRAKLRGFNIIGMKRSGMARSEIQTMRRAYRLIFDPAHPVAENVEKAKVEFSDSPVVMKIIDFISTRDKRYYTVPPLKGGSDDAGDDED
jgi:UDP-N-acetylglucosamine acyltransferase